MSLLNRRRHASVSTVGTRTGSTRQRRAAGVAAAVSNGTGFLHSSLLPPGSPLPKTVGGKTRTMEKRERDTAEDRRWRKVCRDVDVRDAGRCRICERRVVPMAVDSRERAERNHIIKRSQGGPDTTANVHLICASRCHDDIHKRGITRVSGDADVRDEKGRLCGIKVERLRRDGWEVAAWV